MKLIVKEPFGEYGKGAEITDPETVKAILGSDNVGHVLKVAGEVEDDH